MSLNSSFLQVSSFIPDDDKLSLSQIAAFAASLERQTQLEEPSSLATAIFMINFMLMELVGLPFLVSLIFYEKNGCDPKKRSLYNQLLSTLWFYCIIGPFIINMITLIRIYIGTLPLFIGYLAMFVQTFGPVFGLLCLNQILIYKILQKVMFQNMAVIEDDYCCIFLTSFNCIIAGLTFCVAVMLDEPHDVLIFICTRQKLHRNR